MPDIETPPKAKPLPERSRMPDIADARPVQTSNPRPPRERANETHIPDIDDRDRKRGVMPDIEDGAADKAKSVDVSHPATMPDIGAGNAEQIERGRMPDIGES
jgi:hypothetical protein